MTLYLDTSVISALFDERNPERQALTKDFFEGRTADRLLVSELTLAEATLTWRLFLLVNCYESARSLHEMEDDEVDVRTSSAGRLFGPGQGDTQWRSRQ